MPAEGRISKLVSQAAERRAAAAARRARYQQARQHGLAARRHLKLTRLDQHDEPTAEATEPEPPPPHGWRRDRSMHLRA